MESTAPTDNRGYFLLPQAYEGGGYYVYGTPDRGRGQYAHPSLVSALLEVARQWSFKDKRKFGIGNISLAGGDKFEPHASHRSGLEVDIRPIRKDGNRLPCFITDRQYDRQATAALIELFQEHTKVQLILFNDKQIPGVRHAAKHSDHFHVQILISS
ncbi:penicillin-insensitive murein endopeptidase [Pseudoduganella sp. OTU4001]|uniref:penicillin-insensitive murein endopeptidase n=1 Tax=Pseudoduganella sp. OTU4001 TaxID=3043854 RepID=UPI00313D0B84